MSIHLDSFDSLANSRELEKRHPSGIHFNETMLSEISLAPSGMIELSYEVDLRKEQHLSLEKILKTHLAKISISLAAEDISIACLDIPSQIEHDIIFSRDAIISRPSNNGVGLILKIIYAVSAPTLRILPAQPPQYKFENGRAIRLFS